MKTLLCRAGLFDGDELDLLILIFSYLCKMLMIIGIAFLVFLLTSKSYSGSTFLPKEVDTGQKLSVNPPKPFQ